MNSKKRERHRKRRFVDRQVQGAVIVQVMRHWLLFFLGAFVVLTYLQVLFGDENRTFFEHVRTTLNHHAPFYFVALCMLPTFINDIIKLSHRFVGPVLRVRKELQRLANGEHVTPIELRKNDFWNDLATDFNAALATMDRARSDVRATQPEEGEQPEQQPEPQLVDCEV